MSGPDLSSRRVRPWGTLLLGLTCLIIFALSWADAGFVVLEDAGRLDPSILRRWGALDWLDVREDAQWWRLGTGALLHGAWWHALLNLWGLFVLGAWVEAQHGRLRWLAVVVLSAAGSGLAALGFGSADLVVGVSGVVFGLGGFILSQPGESEVRRAPGARSALGLDEEQDGNLSAISESSDSFEKPETKRQELVRPGISRRELAFWLVVTLVVGEFWGALSQAGHLGGLIAGVGFGWMVRLGWWGVAALPFVVAWCGWAVSRTLAPPVDAGDFERIGFAQMGHESYAVAWEAFDRALEGEIDSDSTRAELLNASAYARALGSDALAGGDGQLARGLELVRQALAVEPDNADYLDTLGWLLCRQGRVEEGLTQLRAALAQVEGDPSSELEAHLARCE